MNKTNNLWNRIAPISPISIYQVICSFELFSLPCECVFFLILSFAHFSKCYAYALDALTFFKKCLTSTFVYFGTERVLRWCIQTVLFALAFFSLSFFSKLFIKIYLFHDIFFSFRSCLLFSDCEPYQNHTHCLVMMFAFIWCASYEGNEYVK